MVCIGILSLERFVHPEWRVRSLYCARFPRILFLGIAASILGEAFDSFIEIR
jgi:hypothetical protein